jgi:hypothetical protein
VVAYIILQYAYVHFVRIRLVSGEEVRCLLHTTGRSLGYFTDID